MNVILPWIKINDINKKICSCILHELNRYLCIEWMNEWMDGWMMKLCPQRYLEKTQFPFCYNNIWEPKVLIKNTGFPALVPEILIYLVNMGPWASLFHKRPSWVLVPVLEELHCEIHPISVLTLQGRTASTSNGKACQPDGAYFFTLAELTIGWAKTLKYD